jgi:ABC-type uncharacterized transport system substrate-binding protein
MRKIMLIKRIIGIMTAIFLMLYFCSFEALAFGATTAADNSDVIKELDTAPHTKPDGSRFKIAYIDYDEYLPASRQLFYIMAGLEEIGWVKEGSIPFTIDDIEQKNMSTRQMYEELCKTDLGEYIELADNGFFYLAYDDEKTIANTLKEGAGQGIDMVITFGTSAGVFVKSLGLPIPMMDFSATDPVASGIIDSSTDGSGNPNVWAHVEPSPVFRQLKYYDSISHFEKLGAIIYGDETISGVPDIERASGELGFEFVKYNIEEQPRESSKQLDAYYKLVGEKIKQMAGEDIDAFYLTVDLINDLSMIEPLLSPLYDKHIPVYMMDDAQSVKAGGLMLIAANDTQNIGRFIADAIAKVFNGAQAGSLPCIYNSAPSIYVNYRIAKRIGYPLKFDFLAICDEIFS